MQLKKIIKLASSITFILHRKKHREREREIYMMRGSNLFLCSSFLPLLVLYEDCII